MQLLENVSVRASCVLGLGALLLIGTRGQATQVKATQPELELAPISDSQDICVIHDDPPPPPPTTLHFTFTAGGSTWLAIADVPDLAIQNLAPNTATTMRVVEDDFGFAAISPLVDFPTLEREYIFDNGCRETPSQVAMIGRTSGAPVDAGADHWTAASILTRGEVVVAAKLSHCAGSYATTAAITHLEPVTDLALVARARDVLVHSELAAKAVADWKDARANTQWTDDAQIDTIVVRDRDVTWVSAHAHANGIGCGAPTTNFWGLFRVRADGSFEQVALREVDVASIDALIDIDGTPALLAHGLLPAGPILLDTHGERTASDLVPYFGCPC